jgi:hypothetical protein
MEFIVIDYVQEGYVGVLLGVTAAVTYFFGWLFFFLSKLRLFGLKDPRDGALAFVGLVILFEAVWLSWDSPTVTSVAFALILATYSIRNGQRST